MSARGLLGSYLIRSATRRANLLEEEWLGRHRRAMKQCDIEAAYHDIVNFHGLLEQMIEHEHELALRDRKAAEELGRLIRKWVEGFILSAEKLVKEAKTHRVERYAGNEVDLGALQSRIAGAREWLGWDKPAFSRDPHFQALARKHGSRPAK